MARTFRSGCVQSVCPHKTVQLSGSPFKTQPKIPARRGIQNRQLGLRVGLEEAVRLARLSTLRPPVLLGWGTAGTPGGGFRCASSCGFSGAATTAVLGIGAGHTGGGGVRSVTTFISPRQEILDSLVLLCMVLIIKAFQLRKGPWPGSGAVILIPGNSRGGCEVN